MSDVKRTFRIDEEIYEALKILAKEDRRDVNSFVNVIFRDLVRGKVVSVNNNYTGKLNG